MEGSSHLALPLRYSNLWVVQLKKFYRSLITTFFLKVIRLTLFLLLVCPKFPWLYFVLRYPLEIVYPTIFDWIIRCTFGLPSFFLKVFLLSDRSEKTLFNRIDEFFLPFSRPMLLFLAIGPNGFSHRCPETFWRKLAVGLHCYFAFALLLCLLLASVVTLMSRCLAKCGLHGLSIFFFNSMKTSCSSVQFRTVSLWNIRLNQSVNFFRKPGWVFCEILYWSRCWFQFFCGYWWLFS